MCAMRKGIGSGCGSYALPQPMNAWGRNMHDRKQAFRTFLENLSSTSPDEQLFRQLLQDFHDLYDDGWRHSYALITGFMYGRQPPSLEDDAEHDFESLLGVMAANIEELRQCLVFEYEQRDAAAPGPAARGRSSSDHEREFRRLLLSIDKLEDHIRLEFLHLVNQGRFMQDVRRQLNACRQELEGLQSQEQDLRQQLKRQREELRQLTPAFVALLGLFAAILAVIFGALQLQTGLLKQAGEYGLFGLMALLFMILFVWGQLLGMLYRFISTITGREPYRPSAWYGCASLMAAAVCILLAWLETTAGNLPA